MKSLSLIFILAILLSACSTTPDDLGSCKSHDVGYLSFQNTSATAVTVYLDARRLTTVDPGAVSQEYPVGTGTHLVGLVSGAATVEVGAVVQRCQSVCIKYPAQ